MAVKVRTKSVVREYILAGVLVVIIALVLRAYVVWNARVIRPSEENLTLATRGSMEETLMPGDFILVNKLSYHFGDPKPGDLVVFENPIDQNLTQVRRVIATEGDTVLIEGKVVYVDGRRMDDPPTVIHVDGAILPRDLDEFNRDNYGPAVVPANYVFVLGDNRDEASDSRHWGFLDRGLIIGKAAFVYFSWGYVDGGFFGRSFRLGRIFKWPQ